jgi:hypothetical protein
VPLSLKLSKLKSVKAIQWCIIVYKSKSWLRYYIYVCLLEEDCTYKRQDKKTKLPICKVKDINGMPEFWCSQQLRVSKTNMTRYPHTIEEYRRKRFRFL